MAIGSTVYTFTPCCGGTSIKFVRDATITSGLTYQYTGSGAVGNGGALQTDHCYRVSIGSVIGVVNYPPLTSAIVADLSNVDDCSDPDCIGCDTILVFTPCCGGESVSFANTPTFGDAAYQYDGTSLFFGYNGVPLIPDGCYGISRETVPDASAYPTAPSIGSFTIINKVCADENPGFNCAPCTYFYQITNCADETETYCTASNLSAYINNLIEDSSLWPVIQVNIQSEIKCFYVTQIPTCQYPITVVPEAQTFVGCEACQQDLIKYYKLEGCAPNQQQVIYTSTDLSGLVGKIIQLEGYDICYYVTAYDGLVPSDVPVTPLPGTFATCQECSDPRYILEDCLGVADPIITQTDLSELVDSVVTLKTCPDVCWYVSESELTTPPSSVYIEHIFPDGCDDCIKTLPKTCATFGNPTSEPIDIEYIGSSSRPGKITVDGGQTTEKGCYVSWTVPSTIVVTTYGNCDEDGNCPVTPTPKRKVTPGYDTAACTPDYYEKVECAFSEWMYKDVLQKRYGISNCCPDELIKWEIKHEMLMLDSLINPDYICQEGTTCCPPTNSTCGSCGCNSCNC